MHFFSSTSSEGLPLTSAGRIAATGQGDVHSVQRGLVSLTNVTEAGSVYSLAELTALAR